MALNRIVFDPLILKRQWDRTIWEGVPFYRSTALSVMPGVEHGFTTRLGGCSIEPYRSLNLGTHVGDDPNFVAENRRRAAGALGFSASEIALAEQVHGSKVAAVDRPGAFAEGADALITNIPNILLMLMFADCVPIFIFDPLNRAVGLVHSGWKGTAANIVQATVDAMKNTFGSRPEKCLAAIGPCIGFERYEVSLDVAEKFRNAANASDSGTPVVLPSNEFKGTYLVNLRQIVFQQLTAAEFRIGSIAVSDQCTFSNKRDFYSHRRDGAGGAKTGRMAAVIGLKPLNRSRGIN